jgi:glycerol dehydrogenase-like iron-containing ADH family enzyme
MLQEYPGPHGQQCGMGTILTSYILENKYIDWRILKRRLEFIGAATKSKELGINDSVIIKAVGTEAKKLGEKRNRITVFELVEMNDKIAEEVCRATGVINNSMKE